MDGMDIFRFGDEKMSRIRRRKIGFVFQFYNLIPNLNVEENIMLPLLPVSYTHLQAVQHMENKIGLLVEFKPSADNKKELISNCLLYTSKAFADFDHRVPCTGGQ